MIQSVRIKNFKNFKDTTIDGFTKLNIITGENNAGKSNLLEALYCLVGKSMHPCTNILDIRNLWQYTQRAFNDRITKLDVL